ncbi:hypothetical protein LJK88_26530 [Paenibacillus sp. P26]|nr:hypothetical protein LJK88_26530 [Paenibacillus sp. P26]
MASKTDTSGQIVYRFAHAKAKRAFMFKHWPLYLISIPGILYFALFKYVPLFGSAIAFQNYNIFKGITGARGSASNTSSGCSPMTNSSSF